MKKAKILLVDDDSTTLLMHKMMLDEFGKIFTAKNGNEALDIIKKDKSFSVLVSDQYMPEMNGSELLHAVRGIAPDIVRIMITGFADLGVAMQAVNMGNVFRFLVKPCSKEDLVLAVADGICKNYKDKGGNAVWEVLTEPLTERETQVLQLLGDGFTSGEIALTMGITIGTVKTHVHNIFGKLEVNSRIKAVARAKSIGVI